MRTNFVIMTPGRTGSNHLSSLLDSHGEVLCHGELFGQNNIAFAQESKRYVNHLKLRDNFPFTFCKYHLTLDRKFKAVGFRVLLDQNKNLIEKVVKCKKIKKIFLLRRNELKRFISAKLAEETKVWHATNNSNSNNDYNGFAEQNERISVDIKDFIESTLWLERELKKHSLVLEKTKQKYLLVFYEDLNNADCIEKILNFLNLPQRPLSSLQTKINPEEIELMVKNFQELKSNFEKTKIEWMLSS